MRTFGLIGFPISHSFSQKYFTEKFEKEGIANARYQLFPLKRIEDFPELIKTHQLSGLNVTIPYKKKIIRYLDGIDSLAERTGAVNVIKFTEKGLIGYNSDCFGFYQSLQQWLGSARPDALILGTGGAAAAVSVALQELGISYRYVSREHKPNAYTYDELEQEQDILQQYLLIINTSPVGMYPTVAEAPPIPYGAIGHQHFLYDLVYNPLETLFMTKGKKRGAQVKNGLEMLHLQAEKAWEIWNS
jgi:shikimate dehydrogenase